MRVVDASEVVPDFVGMGVRAFTTTRATGSFGMLSSEPVGTVMARWAALRRELRSRSARLATSGQEHGSRVVVHQPGWEGWLRIDAADGHVSVERGTALAVSVADCVPVFLAHPGGAVAILHAGWRGVVAGILERGIQELRDRGLSPGDLRLHLGPSICGACYEVGPDVHRRLTGALAEAATSVDLRHILAARASTIGITHVSSSLSCTRCHNDRFFSHRCGDEGRQISVIVADA